MRLPVLPPRIYQLPIWGAIQRGVQYIVHTWPRRAGKDLIDFSATVSMAMQRPGNYYYMFPSREWAKRALWNNKPEWAGGKPLIDVLCPEALVSKKNNSEYYIDLKNGSTIKIDGTDSGTFIGQGGVLYVLSEFQKHKEGTTDFLAPILREATSTVIFNGTLLGMENQLWKMYNDNIGRDNWHTEWLTLAHTMTDYWISESDDICINPQLQGLISPYSGKPYQNIQADVDSGMISFSKARREFVNEADSDAEGAYYSYEIGKMKEQNRLVTRYDGYSPIYTFWDLGGDKETSDTTAILFVCIDTISKRSDIIDYYENKGKLRGHYFDVIRQKNYNYGGHFIPHDGKRSNPWTGEAMVETARKEHNVDMRYVPKADRVADEIEITRRDMVHWHLGRSDCGEFFDRISKYHESETTGKPCHRNNCSICHGASHGADTGRLLAMAKYHGLVDPYILNGGLGGGTPDQLDDDWIIT